MSQGLSGTNSRGFTMLELLVAMAVLALLMLLVIQIVGLSSSAVSGSSKKMDSVAAGRFVLDRLGADLAARLRREDAGSSFAKANGSDALVFFSEVGGYAGPRQLAAVGYRMKELPDRQMQLERGVTGGNWDDGFSVTPPVIEEADYSILADSVLRMEFCFLTTKGELVSSMPADFSTVAAVVVAVATLDSASRQMLNLGDIAALASELPDSDDEEEPLATWEKARSDPQFGAGLPARAVQGLRFYQRTFYVR